MPEFVHYHYGEKLAYAEYGDPNGYPILVQHGLIASIGDGHLFKGLIDAGRRVICAARPGYGESSPYQMRSIGEWGELTRVLVDELNLERFDVLGISSGAPYSYAAAYRLADRVQYVYILSGIPALYAAEIRALWPYPIDPDATIPELEELANRLLFADLQPQDRLRGDVMDSMRNHAFGIGLDWKLRGCDWGFQLAEVTTPVIMQHSRVDDQVPLAAAEMTARLLPNCHLVIREKDPHFSEETLDDFTGTVIHRGG